MHFHSFIHSNTRLSVTCLLSCHSPSPQSPREGVSASWLPIMVPGEWLHHIPGACSESPLRF